MKKINLLLTALFFVLTFNTFSQTKEIIYIRIQENISLQGPGAPDSYISIIYPNKPTKFTELSKLGKNGKAAEENGKIIQKELSELINEKYEISSCSIGSDNQASTTLIILTRQKEK